MIKLQRPVGHSLSRHLLILFLGLPVAPAGRSRERQGPRGPSVIRGAQEAMRSSKVLLGLRTGVGASEGLGWSNLLKPQKICPEHKAAVFLGWQAHFLLSCSDVTELEKQSDS